MFVGDGMKLQTGVRFDAELWRCYRLLCGREKLRPSQPIEDFLKLVVGSDSAMSVLSLMREAAKAQVEGCEAYARVLLDWYTHGKVWIRGAGDEMLSVETQLLDALKVVADPDLRGRIEAALIETQRKNFEKKAGQG